MMKMEKYLPVILSLLLPLLNIANNNFLGDNLEWTGMVPKYIFLVCLLYSVWHINHYIFDYIAKANFKFPGTVLLAVLLNLLYIILLAVVDYTLLPQTISLTATVPVWMVITKLGMATLIFATFQQVLRITKQRESLRVQNLSLQTEKLKSEMETMKQQVNPHFLFNSLNTLIDFIEEDQSKAVDFVRTFSNLYRVVLQSSRRDFVFLEDELAFMNNYWELLKMRLNGAVHLTVSIPEEKYQYLVPPLSLQLLIENAVKHNQATEKKPLQIEVFESRNMVIVQNNIIPKPYVPFREGFGLKNLQKRFSLLLAPIEYGVSGNLFKVILPIKTNTAEA